MTQPRVLVAGVSTRALVESAARAGYAVASVDAFGDLDNLATPALSLVRDLDAPYSADAAARASREMECQAVCYVSDLENYPHCVELLAQGRALWGNPPNVLSRARDPLALSRLLRALRQPSPRVRARAPSDSASNASSTSTPTPTLASQQDRASKRSPIELPTHWLAKPRASGGGHGITEWHPGDSLPRSHILQELVDGRPGSIAFVADGRSAVPFAFSRQLIGDPAFGASGFQYCGSILCGTRHTAHGSSAPATRELALLELAAATAQLLTEELALVGVNCIDFIARARVPHVIELNPRYSASMELAERAFGFSVFTAHARACGGWDASAGENSGAPIATTARQLPSFDLVDALRHTGAVGKAVLFARRTITMGDTSSWLNDPDVRDVPHPGETILRGHPVCTIFASGRNHEECYAALVRQARGRYDTIESRDSVFREQGTEGGVIE